MGLFTADREKYRTLATAWVVPEPRRCVQCGVCSFNCPMAIDVRRHVWRGEPVDDSGCLTCGECVSAARAGSCASSPSTAGAADVARRHVLIGGGAATMAAAEAIRGADETPRSSSSAPTRTATTRGPASPTS